jgi:hypothetical protein
MKPETIILGNIFSVGLDLGINPKKNIRIEGV